MRITQGRRSRAGHGGISADAGRVGPEDSARKAAGLRVRRTGGPRIGVRKGSREAIGPLTAAAPGLKAEIARGIAHHAEIIATRGIGATTARPNARAEKSRFRPGNRAFRFRLNLFPKSAGSQGWPSKSNRATAPIRFTDWAECF